MSFQARLKSAVTKLRAKEQAARDNPKAVPQTVPLKSSDQGRQAADRPRLWEDSDWDTLLQKLPLLLRQVIELRFRAGLSLSETATELKSSKTEVCRREKLAKALLRPAVAKMVGRE